MFGLEYFDMSNVARKHCETVDVLSFAVFAFAVDDTNARDLLITSATPCAFLFDGVRQREHTEEQRARRRTSGRDTARRA